jgi:hypothetical protein
LLPRDDLKGVKFHQQGSYVWFDGPGRDVVIEYDPESAFMWRPATEQARQRSA